MANRFETTRLHGDALYAVGNGEYVDIMIH